MSDIHHRISLAHLTVLDASPLELIDAAQRGGFDSIGLRIVAPTASDRIVEVIGNEALTQAIAQRLADTGVDILDIEAIWLTPGSNPYSYQAAFATGGRLGAKHVLVVGNDPDEARVTDNFARLCELARPFGLKLMLEFIPYCRTATVEAAHRVVTTAGEPNAGVLIDALHLSRSGGSPADLATLDPAWLSYCQICDAVAMRPPDAGLRAEARTDRLYPGEGALPLEALLDALPAGIPLGVEAPRLRDAELPIDDRARRCGEATRRFLAGYDRDRARVDAGAIAQRTRG
jgi:sugar phosphate isomerase/epimerase